MRKGVLRKGFTIYTPNTVLTIPPGTEVFFYARSIRFEGYDVILTEEGGRWYAHLFGKKERMIFDYNNPPYPISYYLKPKPTIQVPAL